MSWKENVPLQKYYATLESRVGYRLVLGGTRHFGYYEHENDLPLPLSKALRRMEDKLYDVLALPDDSEVLDAGCGIGHVAIRLAKRGLNVCAIDVVEKHVVKARKNVQAAGLGSRVQLAKADYHDLSHFSSDRFDGVYTMETLVHATEPATALSEFFRVMRPGGRLGLFEYDHPKISTMPEDKQRHMEEVDRNSAMPAYHKFEHGVIEQLLEEAGFENIRLQSISKNILPMLSFFWWLAIIPYYLVTLLGLRESFVNTLAAYEGYNAIKIGWSRYVIVSANKPDDGRSRMSQGSKKER